MISMYYVATTLAAKPLGCPRGGTKLISWCANRRASYRTQEPNASTNALSDVALVMIYSATMKHVATTLLVNCYGVSLVGRLRYKIVLTSHALRIKYG